MFNYLQVLDAYKAQAQKREDKLVEVEGSQKEPMQRRARLPQSPPPSSPPKEVEAPLSVSHKEGEIHEEVDPKEE